MRSWTLRTSGFGGTVSITNSNSVLLACVFLGFQIPAIANGTWDVREMRKVCRPWGVFLDSKKASAGMMQRLLRKDSLKICLSAAVSERALMILGLFGLFELSAQGLMKPQVIVAGSRSPLGAATARQL